MGGQTPFGGPMHIMSEGLHMVGQVGGQTLLGSETNKSWKQVEWLNKKVFLSRCR